jgi:hypothetical protein
MGILGLIFAFGFCVTCWKRARWQWRNRGTKNKGRYGGGAAIGNALQVLQQFTQPHVKHVIVQRLDETQDEDEEGEPKNPKEHLLRQAKRIRNGEKIDRLTTLLPP